MSPARRKLYIALGAFTVVAVVVDQVILGPPASADAALPAIAAPVAAATARAVDQPPAIPSFPAFPATGVAAGDRNPFALPPALRPAVPEPPAALADDPRPAGGMTVERFLAEHQLTGVFVLADGGTALVNDEAIAVGDSLDGARLREIRGQVAVFECTDGLARLRLSD